MRALEKTLVHNYGDENENRRKTYMQTGMFCLDDFELDNFDLLLGMSP